MRICLIQISVALAQRGFTGGSGPTGSFKQNRLRRMFENEINWLDKYFGESSLSTEEYKKHDYRITHHWADKLTRNKDRLVHRLYKCGGVQGFANSVESQQGGFSEYNEEKAKTQLIDQSEEEDDDDFDVIVSVGSSGRPASGSGRPAGGSGGRPAGSGRGRRAIDLFEHSEDDLNSISNLDFTFDEIEKAPARAPHMARSGGGRGQKPLEHLFNTKLAIKEIRNVLQGFAIWAKNHIPNCEPNQPEKQMIRASKWFKILGKKIVAKAAHLQAARRNGQQILN